MTELETGVPTRAQMLLDSEFGRVVQVMGPMTSLCYIGIALA
jgi:hypothetical protein